MENFNKNPGIFFASFRRAGEETGAGLSNAKV